jgi:hypothetical protein
MLLLLQAWLVLTVALLAVLGVVMAGQWLGRTLRRPMQARMQAPQVPSALTGPALRLVRS